MVLASATSVTAIHGIGPLTAAIIIGRVGDIGRFPTSGHFARHNGTAPIEASSGPKKRHRLNPRGDRQLNHAIHMAAVPGRPRHTRARLLPPQTSRGQDRQRSDARPQAAHLQRRLPTPPRRHPQLSRRQLTSAYQPRSPMPGGLGRTTRGRHRIQRGRHRTSHDPAHRNSHSPNPTTTLNRPARPAGRSTPTRPTTPPQQPLDAKRIRSGAVAPLHLR
ncbi:MAG: IS110 family transposase [Rhodococcus fascians]